MTVPMPAVPRIMLGAFKLSQFLIGMLLTQTMFWVLGWMGVPNTDNTFPCRVWSLKWITAWIASLLDSANYFYLLFLSQLRVAMNALHFVLCCFHARKTSCPNLYMKSSVWQILMHFSSMHNCDKFDTVFLIRRTIWFLLLPCPCLQQDMYHLSKAIF
jgi:hypothetical protein